MFIILTFSVVYADIVIRRKLGCITFFFTSVFEGKRFDIVTVSDAGAPAADLKKDLNKNLVLQTTEH